MSAAGMTWACAQKAVKGNDFLTLLMIADGARSIEGIAEATHTHELTAMVSIRSLQVNGYIVSDGPDRYTLPDHIESQEVAK